MSIYYGWFGAMLVVSIAWIIWYLKHPLADNNLDLEHSNIALGKQKKQELELDLERGFIDKTQFDEALEDISDTLASELQQKTQAKTLLKPAGISTTVWILILVIVPIFSLFSYQQLSTGILVEKTLTQQLVGLSLTQGVVKVEQHLQDNPQDTDALKILALGYFELGQVERALQTYETAYRINPKDVRLLSEYASAMITSKNNQFDDQSVSLIKQALEIEPNAVDALYLAGMLAVSVRDLPLAKNLWQRALDSLPENSADRQALVSILQELKRTENPKVSHTVSVNATFSEALLARRSPEDYVMIYVKPVQGRPMPIAIQKLKLKEFSGQIVLSDMNSVMPTKLLSQHDKVRVVVRVSKTGGAMKQADDLQAMSDVVSVGDNPSVDLKLD
jgi:cytochrome c-type biogenesis protein CcmH